MLDVIDRNMRNDAKTLLETVILRLLAETGDKAEAMQLVEDLESNNSFNRIFDLYVNELVAIYEESPLEYFDLNAFDEEGSIDTDEFCNRFRDAVNDSRKLASLRKILVSVVDRQTSSIDNSGILAALDATLDNIPNSFIIGAFYSEIPPDESIKEFRDERILRLKYAVSDNYTPHDQMNWAADPALLGQIEQED